jgi:signal transduction histidine kinase
LHDEVGQALTAISVNLALLKTNGTCDAQAIRRRVADAQHLLQQTMTTVHNFARELRPAMLDELGLLPALRSCLKSFADRTGLRVHLTANPLAEKLNSKQKTVLFRIAQESLTNVARHAQASRVDVAIRKAGANLSMEVADNGKSFHPASKNVAGRRKRLGLLGMQERVRLVNGRFSIKTEPGKGTTVRVLIPFKLSDAPAVPQRAHSTKTSQIRTP